MALDSAAKKRKFLNSLLKNVKDEVIAAVDQMPQEWDEAELQTYLASKLHNQDHVFELRGNTARGRAYAQTLEYNSKL